MPEKKMIFSCKGLILDQKGRYYQPKKQEILKGFVELEVPKNSEIQFFGLDPGWQKIFIGPINILDLEGEVVLIKPFKKFNKFELRILQEAVKNDLIAFSGAIQALSIAKIDLALNEFAAWSRESEETHGFC